MSELEIPEGFRQLNTQVAGHTFEATNAAAIGLLLDAKTGCVLKPFGKPECGERETSFYESIRQASILPSQQQTNDEKVLQELRELVPKYYNKLKLQVNRREHMFLKLENVTHGMQKPCIMDVKVGKRTWDPLATEEKRNVEEMKYVHCKQTLGLCLPGFQLYTVPHGEYQRYGKEYGKRIDVVGFRATIARFLNAQTAIICEPLLQEVLKQLYAIRKWFQKQNIYHFYASSLLLAYDYVVLEQYFEQALSNGLLINGNNSCNSLTNATNTNTTPPTLPKSTDWIRVKMIDFAHVFPAENNALDTNYLFGLDNLIAIIEELLPR